MEGFINQLALNEKPSSKILIDYLENSEEELDFTDSYLYYNLPIYLAAQAEFEKADVLLVSKNHGIYLFKCLEETSRTLTHDKLLNYVSELEELYAGIYSKLLKSKSLRKNPASLHLDINPVIFLSNHDIERSLLTDEWDELSFISTSDLISFFEKSRTEIKDEHISEIIAILEGSKALSSKKERQIQSDTDAYSKGKIIAKIEDEIALFDNEQRRAGFNIIDGPQRIRGLAGSGKTVILAMKAAQIHLHQPNAKILFTYWTKSLMQFAKKLITMFYRQYSDSDPNWDNINIMHAWGGKNIEGTYYNACIDNNVIPINFSSVRGYGKHAFNKICESLEDADLKVAYDYVLIDEAQDFPVSFYRLCRKIAQNNRVIWAYDECQNILDVELQNTVETFGIDKHGNAYIDLSNNSNPDQDLVLHKCYRNPKNILVSAFAIGMGIYSNIVQLPESVDLWEDWGFEVVSGTYKPGTDMVITRPDENSPLLKNELLDSFKSNIKFEHFESIEEECSFVVDCILDDLNQSLNPEDILVISLDDKYARYYFKTIADMLKEKSVKCFNLFNASSSNTNFTLNDAITLSSVYRAKGNETPQVYIIGVDRVFLSKNHPESRNKIFTAMTRAKGWVHITGCGESAEEFCAEMQQIIDNDFQLNFKMPDVKKLKVLQRDLQLKQAFDNKLDRIINELVLETGYSRKEVKAQVLENFSKKVE